MISKMERKLRKSDAIGLGSILYSDWLRTYISVI